METEKLRNIVADFMTDSEVELRERFEIWIDKRMRSHKLVVYHDVHQILREIIPDLIASVRTGGYERILVHLKGFIEKSGFEHVEAGLRAFRSILVNEMSKCVQDIDTRHRIIELIYRDFDIMLDGVSKLNARMHAQRLEQEIMERTEELVETKDLYRGLVENSPIGVCLLQEGKIKFANDELARIGRYKKEDLLGMEYHRFLTPESLEEHREGIERRQHGLNGALTYKAKALRKDGSTVEVEIHSVPTTFKGGPATQALVRDITQEKRIEQLRQSFFSNVSHELKTPLTTISGNIKFLVSGKMGELNPSQEQALEAASEETDKLDRLVDTILELASLDSESFMLHLSSVNMTRIIKEAVNSKALQAEQKSLRLEMNLQDNLSPIIGDETRISTLMRNLVDNAVKFTPEGGTVRIKGIEDPDNVIVEVSDTGIGIAEEEQSRIFDRFYQVDSSSTRMYGGAGLGLSICKEIVDLHGGRIEVESDVGKGSTFRVLLPKERGSR
ncbi:MAG: sensor histidine kinase [Thermoplasmata archaeon]